MRNLILVGTTLMAVACVATASAAAQDVVKDPTAIASCLCERQRLDALHDAMDQQRQRYERSQQTVATLDRELAERRSTMNVTDSSQVDAYKQLLDRHDSAAASLSNGAVPDYNAALARYSAARSEYDAGCGGKSFDQAVYNRVEASLSCPKP